MKEIILKLLNDKELLFMCWWFFMSILTVIFMSLDNIIKIFSICN